MLTLAVRSVDVRVMIVRIVAVRAVATVAAHGVALCEVAVSVVAVRIMAVQVMAVRDVAVVVMRNVANVAVCIVVVRVVAVHGDRTCCGCARHGYARCLLLLQADLLPAAAGYSPAAATLPAAIEFSAAALLPLLAAALQSQQPHKRNSSSLNLPLLHQWPILSPLLSVRVAA